MLSRCWLVMRFCAGYAGSLERRIIMEKPNYLYPVQEILTLALLAIKVVTSLYHLLGMIFNYQQRVVFFHYVIV